MTDLALYITWKNYSSWSLRAWLLMRALEIPFEEILVPMTDEARLPAMAGISPTRKVPCLIDRGMSGGMSAVTIWETLAIAEYLDELFPERGVWPEDLAKPGNSPRDGRGNACRLCRAPQRMPDESASPVGPDGRERQLPRRCRAHRGDLRRLS